MFDQQWLQNGTPKFGKNYLLTVVWGSCFACVFVGSPRLHFGAMFASFWSPRAPCWNHFGTHVGPQSLNSGVMYFRYLLLSFRFVSQKYVMVDPFASVRFTKSFYTSLRPRRQKLLKTYHQYVSRKNLQITHRGRQYREAFYDTEIPEITETCQMSPTRPAHRRCAADLKASPLPPAPWPQVEIWNFIIAGSWVSIGPLMSSLITCWFIMQ